MSESMVEDVLSGRRLPYSRAFARAGFSAVDAETWRRAGWVDADAAAPWHRIVTASDAAALRRLSLEGFETEQAAAVARFSPTFTAAWTRALLGREDDADIDLRETDRPDDARRDIDLRRRVRDNLYRGRPVGTSDPPHP